MKSIVIIALISMTSFSAFAGQEKCINAMIAYTNSRAEVATLHQRAADFFTEVQKAKTGNRVLEEATHTAIVETNAYVADAVDSKLAAIFANCQDK